MKQHLTKVLVFLCCFGVGADLTLGYYAVLQAIQVLATICLVCNLTGVTYLVHNYIEAAYDSARELEKQTLTGQGHNDILLRGSRY